VTQDVRRNYAKCFVARTVDSGKVAGFYTLSSTNVPLTEVPEALAAKLPRYPTVSAVMIGRLGRHIDYRGLGLGAALIFDAIRTVAMAPIGAHAIFADAINEQAALFYAVYGFAPLTKRPLTLHLPLPAALPLLPKH
jgi:ribosomal protein S18 acetylase RimI-like enzyme